MLMIVLIIVTRKHFINVVDEFRGLLSETPVDQQTIEAFVGVLVVLPAAFPCGGSAGVKSNIQNHILDFGIVGTELMQL